MSADIKVYVAAVEDFADWDVLPVYAKEELNTIRSPRVIAEKKAGYGLLCYGAKDFVEEFDVEECYLGETGKPLHPRLWFSISHSGGTVAVAVAKKPVGMDVESFDSLERVKRLESKIVCRDENYENPLVLWTLKEAVFKLEGKDRIFRPADIDTRVFDSASFEFEHEGKMFVLSVATEGNSGIKFYRISDGEEICIKKLDI